MQKVLKYRSLFIGFLFLNLFTTQAQDCAKSLKKAQKAYDIGDFEKVKKLVNPCLGAGVSKEEELKIYKLLTLIHVFDDEEDSAAYYMEEFLKIDPEYEINDAIDPVEFVALYNQFNTLPVLSIGVTGGASYTNVDVFQRYGLNSYEDFDHVYNRKLGGYQVGIRINKYLSKRLVLDLEALLSNKTYEHQSNLYEFSQVTMNETQRRIEIPLILSYDFFKHKIRPYIGVGIAGEYLLGSSAEFSRTYTDTSLAEIKGQNIDMTDHRQSLNYSLIGTAGIRFKVPKGMISLDFRYKKGMLNQVNKTQRYTNNHLMYRYYYIDSDFALDHYILSVGYVYSFYNPKRKKKKETPTKE